jgi:hypothetical protein
MAAGRHLPGIPLLQKLYDIAGEAVGATRSETGAHTIARNGKGQEDAGPVMGRNPVASCAYGSDIELDQITRRHGGPR